MEQYVEKYMYPDRESVVWMADKLETWGALESGDPDCLLEKEFLPFYREVVREFRKRIDRACIEYDTAFLRRLLDAAALAAKGKVSHRLDLTGTAVYVFEELRRRFGFRPSREQVRQRTEQLRKEGGLPPASDRQWARVFDDLGELFRSG